MVLMPPSRLGELAILRHMLQKNLPVPRVETEIMRCDGSLVPVARTITPWRDEFDGFAGGVALLTDMTPRREYERKLRERRQQLRELSARIEQVKEEELLRISRELHDELGQQLTGLRLDLAWLDEKLGEVRPDLSERLGGMARIVDDTLKQVRRISSEMRPPLLEELGLPSAIVHWADQLQARSSLKVSLNLQADLANLRAESSLAIYRILQEASTNVLRHAEATHLWVETLDDEDYLVITVRDDGRGFEPPTGKGPRPCGDSGSGLGLVGMRERAHLWGGELRLDSTREQGSKLEIRLPRTRIARDPELH
jgi:signal transduction histidine kinase